MPDSDVEQHSACATMPTMVRSPGLAAAAESGLADVASPALVLAGIHGRVAR